MRFLAPIFAELSSSRRCLLSRCLVTRCRAVVLPRFGGPDVLQVRPDVEIPDLGPNDVLVRARAVSVNALDTQMRVGYGRSIFEPVMPLILGRDVSGEVVSFGASVHSFTVGQEVFGALHPTAIRGTYSDYVILSQDELTLKPSSLTHVEASAIPFAALTAWRALKTTAGITSGKKILVMGAGGAVGFSAVQIAVSEGCLVWATCGSQSISRVHSAGAEQVLDYNTEDLQSVIEGKFDVVLDTVGNANTEMVGVMLLRKGGHYMTLQGEAAPVTDKYGIIFGLPLSLAILIQKQVKYRYSHGIGYWWTYMRTDSEGLEEIRLLCESGKLKIPVEKTFPITQVSDAHRAKDQKEILGKVVLEM